MGLPRRRALESVAMSAPSLLNTSPSTVLRRVLLAAVLLLTVVGLGHRLGDRDALWEPESASADREVAQRVRSTARAVLAAVERRIISRPQPDAHAFGGTGEGESRFYERARAFAQRAGSALGSMGQRLGVVASRALGLAPRHALSAGAELAVRDAPTSRVGYGEQEAGAVQQEPTGIAVAKGPALGAYVKGGTTGLDAPEPKTLDAAVVDVNGPRPERLRSSFSAAQLRATPTEAEGLKVLAYQYHAPIYTSVSDKPRVEGIARRGTILPVRRQVYGPGCDKGRWFELTTGGYVCTGQGFFSGNDFEGSRFLEQRPVDREADMPFRYGEVVVQGAPRFTATKDDEGWFRDILKSRAKVSADGVEELRGEYLLAIDKLTSHRVAEQVGWFYQTVRGRYVRPGDVRMLSSTLHSGELLDEKTPLPLAFVLAEARAQPCFVEAGAGPHPACGRVDSVHAPEEQDAGAVPPDTGVANELTLERYSRFPVTLPDANSAFVVLGGGLTVERSKVRLALPHARPSGVGRDEKWIHISLGEQTLVAYEGDTPVFATLVSTGKKGYATPRGNFRVHEKYLAFTMSATDPIDGFYEVEEVPYAMFYWRGYAIHGAYWHDDFGQVKSHGCTNLAPIDSKWLYYWSAPEVPVGWHGKHDSFHGTHVSVTH